MKYPRFLLLSPTKIKLIEYHFKVLDNWNKTGIKQNYPFLLSFPTNIYIYTHTKKRETTACGDGATELTDLARLIPLVTAIPVSRTRNIPALRFFKKGKGEDEEEEVQRAPTT